MARLRFEGLLFSRSMKFSAENLILTTSSLVDAKHSLINGTLYQVIGVIKLNEIKNWSETKTSLG